MSNDLRHKVIEAIELNGMKRCEASECFGVSRTAIYSNRQIGRNVNEGIR